MTDDLIERLRNLRVILKSGDYNGADLMKAWCAMADAADRLEAIANKLQRMEEALDAIVDGAARRDPKWAGMTAKDIALAALKD